jgi:hypothetical protein
MFRHTGKLVCAALFFGSAAFARDLIRPAELPPQDYAGQQYVDSKGCLFLRAGSEGGKTVWLPRVTREGASICGYPPSGKRVPVVKDGAAPPEVIPEETETEAEVQVAADALLVSVGSFAVAANADDAERQLIALGLPVHRGTVVRRGKMLVAVFAGPFSTQEAAKAALGSTRAAGFEDATIVKF